VVEFQRNGPDTSRSDPFLIDMIIDTIDELSYAWLSYLKMPVGRIR
jgi:hypothetical protein